MNILYNKSALKLLKFLSENPSSGFHLREIVKKAEISLGSASKGLKTLESQDMLLSRKIGKSIVYRVNLENPAVREFKVLVNVLSLEGLIKELKGASDMVVLFGSYSNGTNNEGSDVDLFVETSDKQRVIATLRKYDADFKLSPILMDPAEASRLGKKDRPLKKRIDEGRILWENVEI